MNYKLIIIGSIYMVSLLTVPLMSFAQPVNDIDLMLKEEAIVKDTNKRHPEFGFNKEDKSLRKYNPIKLVFSSMMFVYQKAVSKQFSADCLYNPSCSAYSKSLIKQYGLLRGVVFSAERLSRCNRLSALDLKKHGHKGKKQETPAYYKLKP